MLDIENLHVHRGSSHILQGLSLSAAAGEVFGVFGRNGVGKTTLLQTIAGWLWPSDGTVRLSGEELGGMPPEWVCQRGVGFVPEDRRIFPGLTVEENLSLAAVQAPGRGRAATRARLEEVFGRFPRLRERRCQIGTTLSGGEQQMLAMARVLMGEPRLVLVDEPSEGLAPMVVEEVYAVIDTLKRAGSLVLLVEQNLHLALRAADRFCLLERGAVTLRGDARSATDRDALLAAAAV